MKKVLPIAAVLLVASAAALIVTLSRKSASRISATALAPAESVLFVHLPDLRQSAVRWPQTALAQIGNEPEVQTFLERPRQGLPFFSQIDARMDQIRSIAPREAFVAVVSVASTGNPRVIGGFSFSGNESAVNEVLKEARAAIQKSRPAGKADLVPYAGVEIETYTDKEFTMAQVVHDQWCLVSNDVELLQSTLDRLDGKPGAGAALTAGELYKEAVTPLPAESDAVAFGRLDSLTDTLVPLLAAAGQTADQRQLEKLQKTKAFGAALKMDGQQLRDSVFIISDAEPAGSVMPRRGLDLSTPDTLLFYASNIPQKMEVPAGSLAPLAMVAPGLNGMEQALQEKGLSFADFGKIFGPELTFLLDWPADAAQPALVVGFDLRDAARARGFLETVTSTPEGWTRQEQDGAVIYSSPMLGMIPGPVLALAGDFMVAGFSQPDVAAGIERLKAKKNSLAQSEAYQAVVSQVSPPTEAFGYLDTARFFERSYGLVRPFLGMALALSPDSGKYIDAGKLPSAEAITRHLTPSVYSETVSEKGTLIESAGTLTFNQAIGGAVLAGVAAALPTLQATLKSAPALQGLTPPGAAPSSPTLPGTTPVPPTPPVPSAPEGD